jgi:hypothetical protein
MGQTLTQEDCDLIIKTTYMRDEQGSTLSNCEARAFGAVEEYWKENRPDDLRTLGNEFLEHYDPDENVAFAFADAFGPLLYETYSYDGNLHPIWQDVEHGKVSDKIHNLTNELKYDIVEALRKQLRELQQATRFSPREFTALTLNQRFPKEEHVASKMNISVGNLRGKLGLAKDKINEANTTIKVADDLGYTN